jgi:hypothetical protein
MRLKSFRYDDIMIKNTREQEICRKPQIGFDVQIAVKEVFYYGDYIKTE